MFVPVLLLVVISAVSLPLILSALGTREKNSLLEYGETADAVIPDIAQKQLFRQTGDLEVALLLEVCPQSRPAYTIETIHFIPLLEILRFHSGAIVRVKFDPQNPTKLVVLNDSDYLGGATSGGGINNV